MPRLAKNLSETGRNPSVKLEVHPLDTSKRPYTLDQFNAYTFSSSILIPVDTFSFTFKLPIDPRRNKPADLPQEGDTVQLSVANVPISTGYIDAVEIVTNESGTAVTIVGRDILGVLEDNDAVNSETGALWGNHENIDNVVTRLTDGTRLSGKNYELRGIERTTQSLFATFPGESKLASLQRFLYPINALAWTTGDGTLILGRPSFSAGSLGTIGIQMLSGPRGSNVLDMRIRRASGQIANAVLPIWSGMESVQDLVGKQNIVFNAAEGPSRLHKGGHKILRAAVTSAPDAADRKDGLAEAVRLVAEGANYLQNTAARIIAAENVSELTVSALVVGHINENGDPFVADQIYRVMHDAAGLDKNLYLQGVTYQLNEDGGQTTALEFINLNTIVAGSTAPGVPT